MSKGGRSTTTSTPQIPPWLQDAMQGTQNAVNQFTSPLLPAGGFTPSADTTAGQGLVRNFANSQSPLAGLQNFQTPLTWTNYQVPTQANVYGGPAAVNEFQAAQVGDVADIQARRGSEFMKDYSDPYLQDVVNTSLADYDIGVDRSLNALRLQAGAGGAFGGSRQGVAEGSLLGEAQRGRGSLAAGLRSDAFRFGAQAGMQDASRFLSAAQSNQGTQLQRAISQAGLTQGANAANADARNRVGMFNVGNQQQANIFQSGQDQQARQFFAGQDLAARTANAGNAIATQGMNINAAQGLDSANAARAAALLGSGQSQDQLGWQALQARINALGPLSGAIGQSNTGTQTPGALDWVGQAGQLGLLGYALLCWVAREVYGTESGEWITFRNWLQSRAPKWLYRLYAKHGARFAWFIRDKPRIKAVIRKMMDWSVANV